MQFGLCVATHIDNIGLIEHAERLGFDRVWVPDSQMIWSDCYATLALAAQRTSRIQLGTGVAIVGTRIAPVTAHSIATINRIAPGRTFLGIGSGHTAMRVMGFDPVKAPAFREYVRVVRELLAGEEVEYTLDGETRLIRFLHRDLGFIDIDDPIRIYVAANGPLALRVAGGLRRRPRGGAGDAGGIPPERRSHRPGRGRGRADAGSGRLPHRRADRCVCAETGRAARLGRRGGPVRLDGRERPARAMGDRPPAGHRGDSPGGAAADVGGVPGLHRGEEPAARRAPARSCTSVTALTCSRKNDGS